MSKLALVEHGKDFDETEGPDIEPENWDDWEEDDEPMKCFFCDFQHSQFNTVLAHAKGTHSFDFRCIASLMQLDFYGMVKLINFARSHDAAVATNLIQTQGIDAFINDSFLIPVIAEDPMLCRVMDLNADASDSEDENSEETSTPEISVEDQNKALRLEIQRLRAQMETYLTLVREFTNDEPDAKEEDNDTYYFESYSKVGIHKEMITDKVRHE